MQRKACAVWRGDVKSGRGILSTESNVLDKTQYSFSSRFENGIGTNPEELLAARTRDVSRWRSPRKGGSVRTENVKNLMAQSEIDGFLVGGASPVSFESIVNLETYAAP